MDHLAPLMFDVSNVDIWKIRMSVYLKALGLHVYLATTKKTYSGNAKYIEANAQALNALKHSLKKRIFIYVFSLWFHFCSVEYIDLSRATNDNQCGERI